MLCIKTYIAPSRIHGTGLFAAEDIPRDQQIVDIVPGFDFCFTPEEYESLPEKAKNFMMVYGYKDKWDGLYHVALDNARFTNHSDTPNTYFDEKGDWFAASFIKKDEELTANYRDFDEEWEAYFHAMLNNRKEAA